MMERYLRQSTLAEIGEWGQQQLRRARVLVVGVGGLGAPAALYLAAAGVGHLTLVDDDRVSLSNLQRQILYTEADVGRLKVDVAAQRLRAINSDVEVESLPARIDESNAETIIAAHDIVIDCCDNFPTRLLIDRVACALRRPYVYGAIEGFEGQVAVFDAMQSVRYADLYAGLCAETTTPSSVVGPTAAIVGAAMAHEAMKIICGYGEVLRNRLWTIDLRTMISQTIELC